MKKIIKVLIVAMIVMIGITTAFACGNVSVEDRPIQIVSRESGSGTRAGFFEYVTGDKNTQLPLDSVLADSTASMLSNVSSNPGAIGYDSFGYVTNDVKILKLDGVDIQDTDNYPLKRSLTVVYKDKLDSSLKSHYYDNYAAEKFLEYIQSSDVKDKIQEGYVAIDNSVPYVVEDDLPGLVSISGSTSLEPLMQQLKAMYHLVQPNVRVDITAGGSGVGRDDVRDDKVDFGMISAELTDEQREDIQKGDQTIQVLTADIAIDKIAIIVNKKNPYDEISKLQLQNIYDINKPGYKDWKSMYL